MGKLESLSIQNVKKADECAAELSCGCVKRKGEMRSRVKIYSSVLVRGGLGVPSFVISPPGGEGFMSENNINSVEGLVYIGRLCYRIYMRSYLYFVAS
jgi:hypothetical protein